MFESIDKLVLGFVSGIVFGFVLQKGRVAKYRVIMAQFLLKDWTVFKIMATAVVVGSIGVYAMHERGLVRLEIKPAALGGVISGAILFGIGLSIFGLCPGTSVAGCGEGRRDAIVGVLGMLFGAGAYVVAYEKLQPLVKGFGDLGKVTLPELTNVSPWAWIVPIALLVVLVFTIVEWRHHHPRRGRVEQPA
jgi:uncharacterized protein